IHEAEALRLSTFVFSASAAIAAERLSRTAERARLDFPVETGASDPTTVPSASVVLDQPGGLAPPFGGPAAYFDSLTADMPAPVDVAQRCDGARFAPEAQLLTQFATAVDGGVIGVPAKPSTAPADPAINADQAARRLSALGAGVGAQPTVDPSKVPTKV